MTNDDPHNSGIDNKTEQELIDFLLNAESYPHQTKDISRIETHISQIFLTGEYAYKLKKPRKLDFLDFSTLESRRHYLQRELELNRRYAPEIYRQVLAIYKDQFGRYSFNQNNEPVEYVLQMVQFDSGTLFSELLKKGQLTRELLQRLVDKVVLFQRDAAPRRDMWSVEIVRELAETNFVVCRKFSPKLAAASLLQEVERETIKAIDANLKLIKKRQETHVKELHGDLHLGNITLYKNEPTLFDGIEFNESYSCCDSWADIAFLIMDLAHKERVDLSNAVLNRYLEQTDDFEGLRLFPLYFAYRAAVRAKVACLGWDLNEKTQQRVKEEVESYLILAKSILSRSASELYAVGGMSGSGKSTKGLAFATEIDAVVIRSDGVRKVVSNTPLAQHAPEFAYSKEFSERVYRDLLLRAEMALSIGYPVILDATYLDPQERLKVEQWARDRGVTFRGFWCEAPSEIIKQRLEQRRGDLSDANFEVYLKQKEKQIGDVSWKRSGVSSKLSRS